MTQGNYDLNNTYHGSLKILHLLDLIYTSLNEHDTVTELGLIHWNAANAEPFLLPRNIRSPLRQCMSRAEERCSSLLRVLDNENSVKIFVYVFFNFGRVVQPV